VYGLWFVRERKESEDIELLIGMYETEAEAKAAIDRLAGKPGFVDFQTVSRFIPTNSVETVG